MIYTYTEDFLAFAASIVPTSWSAWNIQQWKWTIDTKQTQNVLHLFFW